MASSPIQTPTPSSLRSRRSRSGSSISSNLSLDLSNIPSLVPKPSTPSNTLLITNLENLAIFDPKSADKDELARLRRSIEQHVPVYSWSPIRFLRRVIVTFYDIAPAAIIKQKFDGESILNCNIRIYFAPYNIDISSIEARYLKAPRLEKQFLISPPPSPPHDWQTTKEDPPNKEVHAEDLARALANLRAKDQSECPETIMHDPEDAAAHQKFDNGRVRSRSTTLVYEPTAHGSNAELPVISVEDCEFIDSPGVEMQTGYSLMDSITPATGPMLHTSRPPVELMQS